MGGPATGGTPEPKREPRSAVKILPWLLVPLVLIPLVWAIIRTSGRSVPAPAPSTTEAGAGSSATPPPR